MDKIQKNNN